MLILLFSTAIAAVPNFDPSGGASGFRLPGAIPMDAGHGAVEGNASAIVLYRIGYASAEVRAAMGLTDWLSVELGGGALADCCSDEFHGLVGSATVRGQGSVGDAIRISPWSRTRLYDASEGPFGPAIRSAFGLALEGGSEWIRVDGSVGLVCIDGEREPEPRRGHVMYREPILKPGACGGMSELPEVGVSMLLGEGHRIRASGIYPTLSYGYFGKVLFGEIGASFIGLRGRTGFSF